jgi:PAS domain S-box-containing protein
VGVQIKPKFISNPLLPKQSSGVEVTTANPMITNTLATTATNPAEDNPGQEAIARLAAIVNSSEDGIIGLDLNGLITSWNRGAENIFSYTAQESIGKSMAFLIPSDRLDEEDHILNKILTGEPITHFETERVAKGGRFISAGRESF